MPEDINEKEIEEFTQDKIQHEEKLKNEQSFVSDEISTFIQESESEQIRFDKEKTKLKNHLQSWKGQFTESIESLEQLSKKNFAASSKVASRVIRYFRVSILVFSAAFLGAYFLLFYENLSEDALITISGINLDFSSVVIICMVAILDIILLVIIRFASKSIKNKINDTSGVIDTDLRRLRNKHPDVSEEVFGTSGFFPNILKKVSVFDSKIKGIVRDSSDFIPIADKLSSTITRRNSQIQYRRTMRNALRMYGLYDNPSDDLVREINNLSTISEAESEWLNDAAVKISDVFGHASLNIDEKIIKMMYYDYSNSSSGTNEWNDILNFKNTKTDNTENNNTDNIENEDNVFLLQLAYVLASRTLKIDVSGGYGAIIKLLKQQTKFQLKEFQKDYYDFSVKFQSKKDHMQMISIQLDLYNDETKLVFDTFYPSTLDKDTWEKELAEEICKGKMFDSDYLLLFFYDRIGDISNKHQLWSSIQTNKFKDFIEKLDSKDLLKIPSSYKANKEIFLFTEIAGNMEFDFNQFNNAIDTRFGTIDQLKEKTLHVLEDIDPEYTKNQFREQFSSFVPKSYLTDIANHIHQKLGIASNLFLLFYGVKYDQELSNSIYSKIIKDNPDELSEFLIKHKQVHLDTVPLEGVEKLSSILRHTTTFDLIKIQSTYEKYSNLLEISKKMLKFYYDENIINTENLEFETLIDITRNSENDRFTNIQNISDHLIKTNSVFVNSFSSVSKACCCLLLYSLGDISSHRACELTSSDPIAPEILYHNMEVKDSQSLVTEKHLLDEIINDVLPNHDYPMEYLHVFKQGLSSGFVYSSIQEMMMQKMNNMEKIMKNIENEIQDELDELRDSLKTVLDAEFQSDIKFLEYALQSQIVQVYMITKKSKGSSLPILENQQLLTDAIKELKLDIKPSQFFILGDPKHSLGYSTRIGIVPFKMNFDKFSEKFNQIYDKVVEKRGSDKSQYSLNMIRIMASPTTFNPIRLTSSLSDEDDPLQIIQDLLKARFTNNEKISLITTFQNKDSNLGMREIIEKTCNSKSLFSFIIKELGMIIDVTNIQNMMNNQNFDSKLYDSYKVENFSQLSVAMYETKKSQDEIELKKTLSMHIQNILQDTGNTIEQNDLNYVCNIMYSKLIKFGKILSS